MSNILRESRHGEIFFSFIGPLSLSEYAKNEKSAVVFLVSFFFSFIGPSSLSELKAKNPLELSLVTNNIQSFMKGTIAFFSLEVTGFISTR